MNFAKVLDLFEISTVARDRNLYVKHTEPITKYLVLRCEVAINVGLDSVCSS